MNKKKIFEMPTETICGVSEHLSGGGTSLIFRLFEIFHLTLIYKILVFRLGLRTLERLPFLQQYKFTQYWGFIVWILHIKWNCVTTHSLLNCLHVVREIVFRYTLSRKFLNSIFSGIFYCRICTYIKHIVTKSIFVIGLVNKLKPSSIIFIMSIPHRLTKSSLCWYR